MNSLATDLAVYAKIFFFFFFFFANMVGHHHTYHPSLWIVLGALQEDQALVATALLQDSRHGSV